MSLVIFLDLFFIYFKCYLYFESYFLMLVLVAHNPITHRKHFILAHPWKDQYVFMAEAFCLFLFLPPLQPAFLLFNNRFVGEMRGRWSGEVHTNDAQSCILSFSISLSALGWDSCSWYLISLTVIFLQGKNDAWACQVSWLWDHSWEIPPSVHILPEGCSPLGVDGGCEMVSVSRTAGLRLLALDVTA